MAITKPRKRTLLVFAAILGIAALVAVYFSFDPEGNDYFPPCIFYKLTGWQCPGCGTQRAIHSALHFDFKQAFFYNPALFVAVPLILVLIYLEYFGGKERFPRINRFLSGTKFILALLVAIILYWVGRNLF